MVRRLKTSPKPLFFAGTDEISHTATYVWRHHFFPLFLSMKRFISMEPLMTALSLCVSEENFFNANSEEPEDDEEEVEREYKWRDSSSSSSRWLMAPDLIYLTEKGPPWWFLLHLLTWTLQMSRVCPRFFNQSQVLGICDPGGLGIQWTFSKCRSIRLLPLTVGQCLSTISPSPKNVASL